MRHTTLMGDIDTTVTSTDNDGIGDNAPYISPYVAIGTRVSTDS